jgi:HEPN domain-containing protein
MTKQEHIEYWKEQAESSWLSAEALIEKKQYMMALFCWHLALEKMFKALWVMNNEDNHPPRIHSLIYLHQEAKLDLPIELQDEFKMIEAWNLEGRYPDYQTKLYKTITKEYVDGKTELILKLKQCLQEKLQ